MKYFKQWVLDRVNDEQKHIIHLQEQKVRQTEFFENIKQHAKEESDNAFKRAINEGANAQEAGEFADSVFDSFLDRYDNEYDEITNIDRQIEYHQDMLEVFTLAMKQLESETI